MTIAIVLAGGIGSRLGAEIPKAYVEVCGKPLIIYCLETLAESTFIDGYQIVADNKWIPEIEEWIRKYELREKLTGFSKPGTNRQGSIYNGLMDLRGKLKDEDYVFVHDSARPLLTTKLVRESIDGMNGYDGVLPVLPMKDTVYMSKDGKQIDSLVNRAEIYAGQAPETFVYGKYLAANQRLVEAGEIETINGSSEVAVKMGMRMHLIPGDEMNFKITTMADLDRFEEILKG